MTAKVLSREVLHFQSGSSDKVYVVEYLERGGKSAHFTSYGRRGASLKSNHVSAADASTKLAEKLAEGYKSKASTVGLTPAETDLTKPLTEASKYNAVLPPATAAPAAPAAAPTPIEPPKPEVMELDDLETEFANIISSGVHAGKVEASAITPDGSDFRVQGTEAYTVTMNPMTCTCGAFRVSSPNPCKHLVAVIANHGESWIRGQRADALAAAMGIASEPAAPVAPKAAPAASGPAVDPIAAIFAEFVKDGEPHPLVPLPGFHVWEESHARRLAAGYRRRKPVLAYGPTGTGKTTMAFDFARRINRPLLRINVTPSTTTADLVGRWVVKDGATVWVDGPVTTAMRCGYILLIDETDRIDQGTGASLYPVLEEFATVTLKEKDLEVVEAHPDFAVFLTANSMGLHDEAGVHTGTQAVDAAFISRCGVQIKVGYPRPEVEETILVGRGIPKRIASKVVKASGLIRAMLESGSVVGAWGTRQAIGFAENAQDLCNWEEAFSATAEGAFTADEYKAIWEAALRATGTGTV